MSTDFQHGDLVWARMKGSPSWPAFVVKPGQHTPRPPKKGCSWVYFFGSKNYSWVENNAIEPFEEFKTKYAKYKTASFKKAMEEIEEHISLSSNNPQYELALPPEKPSKASEDNSAEDKFTKLVSQKTPRKSTPSKRANSDIGSSGRNSSASDLTPSTSKKIRTSSSTSVSRVEKNGISSVGLEILNMPEVSSNIEQPLIDFSKKSDLMKKKDVQPLDKKIGFLGAGIIGQGIIKNLIHSNHKINLYNRTMSKCKEIKDLVDTPGKEEMITICETPRDVVENSDIIFNCVSTLAAAKHNITGNCGVTSVGSLKNKGYVEMTSVDPETSKDLCEFIEERGGSYLEAQIQGSKKEAVDGNLIILAAGNMDLFNDCYECFKAMGNAAFYLGGVGFASKTNLVLQLMKGIALVGLSEGLALADRCGLSFDHVLQIFKMSNLNCDYLAGKAELIGKKNFKAVEQAVELMQKDMKLALDLSDFMKQPLLMTSTANEIYKHVRRLGYDGYDASCVYMKTRH